MRGFDRLETLDSLATVDEDAAEYDATIYNRIFVADEVSGMMLENLALAGWIPLLSIWLVTSSQLGLQGMSADTQALIRHCRITRQKSF